MNLAKYIDHTILKSDATKEQVIKLCKEALEHGFYAVCVNSSRVEVAKELLDGTNVKIAAVVGFPLGAGTAESKGFETSEAIWAGADEIDMVINIGKLKDKDYDAVKHDINTVVRESKGRPVKVILETCLLTNEEKVKACELSVAAGARFVKTSTGFSTSGATVDDIKLMRATVGPIIGVKASGGVKDTATAEAMVAAGATRIGTSSGIAIVSGKAGNTKAY